MVKKPDIAVHGDTNVVKLWILRARDRDRDILTRLRLGHQRPVNRGCPDEKYQYVNNNRLTEYPGTPAWTPANSKSRVSVRQLDTRDLLVAGVPISISSKYLYLYLALKLLTVKLINTRSFDFYLRKEIYSSSPYVDFGIHNQLCNVQTASSF